MPPRPTGLNFLRPRVSPSANRSRPFCRQHHKVAEAQEIQEDAGADEAEVEVGEAELLTLAFVTDVVKHAKFIEIVQRNRTTTTHATR